MCIIAFSLGVLSGDELANAIANAIKLIPTVQPGTTPSDWHSPVLSPVRSTEG